MSRAALLAAIAADPAADLPRLVFADWCDDHGEAGRAEFIRLQCQTARTGPTDPGWLPAKLREYELFDRHWAAKRKDIAHPPLPRPRPAGPAVWAPVLDSHEALDAAAGSAPPAIAARLGFAPDVDEYGEAVWWGYWDVGELPPLGRVADRLAPTVEALSLDGTLSGRHLGVLFAVPWPRLTRLRAGLDHQAAEVLAAADLPTARHLDLTFPGDESIDIARLAGSPLVARADTLTVRQAGSTELRAFLAALAPPGPTLLTLTTGYGLDREAVAVPGLARLRALWVDDPNGCDDLLAALADPAVLPELHTLRVSGRCRLAGPLPWQGGVRQVIHPDTPGPGGWQPSVRHGQSPYRWVADAWPD